jgi:hypothetical protein
LKFNRTKTFQSKLYPDVSFDVRAMTEGHRTNMMVAVAEPLAEVHDLSAEIETIRRQFPRDENSMIPTDVDPKMAAEVYKLSDKIEVLKKSKIDPVYVKYGLADVRGVDDLRPEPSEGELRTAVPEDLYQEILQAVKTEVEMSPEERRNLSSPTTSAAEAGGPTSGSTAASVEEKVTTSVETA